jgi:hypothetical protein
MAELRRGMSEDLDNDQAGLLSEKQKEVQDIPFCGCLSVRYYQPYFDVDTVDVTTRISSALLYCRSEQNFLSSIREKPDAYGPFWVRGWLSEFFTAILVELCQRTTFPLQISTTLVFMLAVASHLNGWLSSWMKGGQWYAEYQDRSGPAHVMLHIHIFMIVQGV